MATLDLRSWFNLPSAAALAAVGASRSLATQGGVELVVDRFSPEIACAFVRFRAAGRETLRIAAAGTFRLRRVEAGGWLLLSAAAGAPSYWVPGAMVHRRYDDQGHILSEQAAAVEEMQVGADEISIAVSSLPGHALEVAVWQCTHEFADELMNVAPAESQAVFLWGSHTAYTRPADVYRHLIHGAVFENRYAWPFKRRICSENDAHALHVTLCGLHQSTGKRLYAMLKQQLTLSVLARQGNDGGWRHGEWTDGMEAHLRLHCSAMHLLMDALAESGDVALRDGLAKAAAFVAGKTDRVMGETWFLHDELEESPAKLRQGPFKWVKSHALGKSESNMLVLNTHLDTLVALDRYQALTGDRQFGATIESARRCARAVLQLRSATWLYKAVFAAIDLSMLPKEAALKLPLWKRALKRAGWKYLIPRLPDLKARLPRLVMPNGYIDRELCVRTWAHHYLPINLMDLARYRARFADEIWVDEIIHRAASYARSSGMYRRWAELDYGRYALGFWAEALYHLCRLYPDRAEYRTWLAEAMLMLNATGQGLPPSLLGANAEALAPAERAPYPAPADGRLRLANIGRAGRAEVIVVNPTAEPIALDWDGAPDAALQWRNAQGTAPDATLMVPANAWLWGCAT